MKTYRGELTLMEAVHMGLKEQMESSADVGPILTNGARMLKLIQDLRNPRSIHSAVVPKTF